MGIKLTEKELAQLRKNLPADADGKADLSEVMDGVKAITVAQKSEYFLMLFSTKTLHFPYFKTAQ
uniref:Uncharacterized protein n=1 Tax=Mustela putorius furo TaxID=9669 RepID=M3YUS8_MUSPF